MPRDYRKEYDTYHGTAKQKKRRALRNKANRKAKREGRIKAGDGREVHHTTTNLRGRTRVVSRRANRRAGSPGKRRRRRARKR